MDGVKRTGNGRGGARAAIEQVDIGSVDKQKVVTDDSVLNLAQKRGKGAASSRVTFTYRCLLRLISAGSRAWSAAEGTWP